MFSKKIILVSVLFLLTSLFSGLIFSERYIDSSYVQVIAQEVSPEPVEPGQDFLLKVRVHNFGTVDAKNVKINLDLNYPFYLKNTSESYIDFNSICSNCSAENTYYFTVSSSAVSGIYPIHFNISEINNETVSFKPQIIDISILGKPDLVLETIKVDQNISAGDIFNIKFLLRNIGTGNSRNIKIIPNSDDFMLIGTNTKWFEELGPNKEIIFDLNFISNKDLISNSYIFPIDLEFLGEKQNFYTSSYNIGINLLGKADLSLQNLKITPLNPSLKDLINFEGIIENIGNGKANNVSLELFVSNDENYKYYIGQLNKDDDAPFYFNEIKFNSVGNNKVNLIVNYDDDYGNYKIEIPLNQNINKSNNLSLFFIVLFLFLVLFFSLYLLKNNKKNKNKKIKN